MHENIEDDRITYSLIPTSIYKVSFLMIMGLIGSLNGPKVNKILINCLNDIIFRVIGSKTYV